LKESIDFGNNRAVKHGNGVHFLLYFLLFMEIS
jgi:hypothetical protein